ncbi:HD-GYP domain-containing protein [Endothiovibrio diazotrophicus]
MAFHIDLHSTIVALATALDFVGVDEIHHGKRVALMSDMIADQLGWDDDTRRRLLHAGMLHDCGVSATREHKNLVDHMVWDGADSHCRRGHDYLAACPPLAHLAETIRWHHTPWQELAAAELPPAVRLHANLIFLTDRIDVLYAVATDAGHAHHQVLLHKQQVVEKIGEYANILFSPELMAAFNELGPRESFWLALDPSFIDLRLQEHPLRTRGSSIGVDQLHAIARLFARVVDAKSPFTAEHSSGVARLARHLAARAGRDEETRELIEIAGLLHDLGKLRVPDELLEKPAALSDTERATMISHSYDTFQILNEAFPDTPLPSWAALHHENLLGTGYPFHAGGDALQLEHRIIAVADIFQALAQNRPYRASLPAEEALAILKQSVDEGKLDRQVVEMVAEELETCYRIALGPN